MHARLRLFRIAPGALIVLSILFPATCVQCEAVTLGSFVTNAPAIGNFPLCASGKAAGIWVSTNNWPGVLRAARDLRTDIERVFGIRSDFSVDQGVPSSHIIIVGTLGRSPLLSRLQSERKLDIAPIVGKWESCIIATVAKPFPGIEQALVIAGSDKRGTIFGVYDLCEQMGVSPWHWWADVPPRKSERLFVTAGPHIQGPPAVKYRGIFINDEGLCLMTWARKEYGELNHGMYTNVFELIFRLKGNFLWPAMWDNSFATDDPLNPRLADEYGVVIGTSHHESMMRAWKEWERAGHRKGSWEYTRNAELLKEFWREGLRRTPDYEKVITMGMRGDGDEPMSETESVALLERIVADQRAIIRQEIGRPPETVPQHAENQTTSSERAIAFPAVSSSVLLCFALRFCLGILITVYPHNLEHRPAIFLAILPICPMF